MKRLCAIWVGSIALCGAAQGQTVYSSGAPNGGSIWYGDASYPTATWAAAEFTLSSSASVSGADWWGGFTTANAASSSDSFTLDIYQANNGAVGSLVATETVGNAGEKSTGKFIGATPEYAYGASFSALQLGAGSYFLAIQRTGASGTWGWETTGGTGLEAYQNSAGTWFSNSGVNLAFDLVGVSAAPEAGALESMLAGLALLAAIRSRRTRSLPQRAHGRFGLDIA